MNDDETIKLFEENAHKQTDINISKCLNEEVVGDQSDTPNIKTIERRFI